ncbi:hypothetical protein CC80DRAFT_554562 [Byssothecium circinans]|uniref:Uncharacterized protein n=1 Tax=Byssothecium circinans TaxID=147558 RepID=A0A6A5TCT9_9PLEO|nr:hypothetical protein CC80DRAFT_554562 [Byssothecium circinans]
MAAKPICEEVSLGTLGEVGGHLLCRWKSRQTVAWSGTRLRTWAVRQKSDRGNDGEKAASCVKSSKTENVQKINGATARGHEVKKTRSSGDCIAVDHTHHGATTESASSLTCVSNSSPVASGLVRSPELSNFCDYIDHEGGSDDTSVTSSSTTSTMSTNNSKDHAITNPHAWHITIPEAPSKGKDDLKPIHSDHVLPKLPVGGIAAARPRFNQAAMYNEAPGSYSLENDQLTISSSLEEIETPSEAAERITRQRFAARNEGSHTEAELWLLKVNDNLKGVQSLRALPSPLRSEIIVKYGDEEVDPQQDLEDCSVVGGSVPVVDVDEDDSSSVANSEESSLFDEIVPDADCTFATLVDVVIPSSSLATLGGFFDNYTLSRDSLDDKKQTLGSDAAKTDLEPPTMSVEYVSPENVATHAGMDKPINSLSSIPKEISRSRECLPAIAKKDTISNREFMPAIPNETTTTQSRLPAASENSLKDRVAIDQSGSILTL